MIPCTTCFIILNYDSVNQFETIISKDVGGDRFQAKTQASPQILDLGRYNFLPIGPMGMILVDGNYLGMI